MPMRLLLLLCLTGYVFATKPPDVDCLVLYLKYVRCTWNAQGTPAVNYTFYGWFEDIDKESECPAYMSDNGTNTGCIQPYQKYKRFGSFHTKLQTGNNTFLQEHLLKNKVWLYPPANVSVQNGSDFNLWFYWNHTYAVCAESEVRFRINNKKWETSKVSVGRQSFCINLPSSSSRYELQVRSRLGDSCGQSINWSNWSEPVVWGVWASNNRTEESVSQSFWTPLLYVLGAITLFLLVMMLLHHERLRIIPIPVVPKPSLVLYDMEDWFQFSKGLKGNFKANYNEHACPVREYCHVSQSDSESSDGSTSSVTTDQTDCSIFILGDKSDGVSTPCSSSTSKVLDSSQEE